MRVSTVANRATRSLTSVHLKSEECMPEVPEGFLGRRGKTILGLSPVYLTDRSQGYVWKVIETSQLLSFCWLLRRSGNTEDKKPESPAAKICSSTVPRGVRCSEATNGRVPLYLSSIVKSRSS